MIDNIIFVILNITSILLAIITIKMAFYKNKDLIHWTAFLIALLEFSYCSGILLQVYSQLILGHTLKILLYYYAVGLHFMPSLVFIFIILFIKPETKLNWKLLFLFVIPTVFYILVLTNDYHHYLYIEYAIDSDVVYGKYMFLTGIYNLAIYLIMFIYLIYYSANSFKLLYKQSLIIISSLIIPVLTSLLVMFKVANLPLYANATSVGFTVLIIYYGVLRYNFIKINPVSLNIIINSISELFVVIDKNFNIIGYNKAFEKQFNVPKPNKGLNFFSIFDEREYRNNISQAINEKNKVVIEKQIINKYFDKYFIIDIIPIINNDYIIGTIVLFKDVTELNHKNLQLQQLFDQLKQHAVTIEELAVVKERNRMASEVHDTLGHAMTSIKALLDLSLVELNNNSLGEVRKVINDAREFTKEGMGELRRSILGLSSSGLESDSIIDAIKSLIIKFESLGVHIDFSVDEPELYREKQISFSATVYRLCQEALTNSVKHGKAKNISIIIRTINELVRISIIDDGCGCKDINKGFGLSGMEQRVKNLNGKILLGSDGVKGFNIHIEIPVKELT
jgi:signal transduction histidine kinase